MKINSQVKQDIYMYPSETKLLTKLCAIPEVNKYLRSISPDKSRPIITAVNNSLPQEKIIIGTPETTLWWMRAILIASDNESVVNQLTEDENNIIDDWCDEMNY